MSILGVSRLLVIVLVVAACNAGQPEETTEPGESTAAADVLYPDVVGVDVTANPDGSYLFAVTLSSPYDTPDRYADAWRIKGEDGTVYGVRELAHDHANEQPFTRSLDGVEIPGGVTSVTVEGRDLANGWGGATMEVQLPDRGE